MAPPYPASCKVPQGTEGKPGNAKIASGAPTHSPSPQTEHPPGGVAGQGPCATTETTRRRETSFNIIILLWLLLAVKQLKMIVDVLLRSRVLVVDNKGMSLGDSGA
jgi:hypothetical protein